MSLSFIYLPTWLIFVLQPISVLAIIIHTASQSTSLNPKSTFWSCRLLGSPNVPSWAGTLVEAVSVVLPGARMGPVSTLKDLADTAVWRGKPADSWWSYNLNQRLQSRDLKAKHLKPSNVCPRHTERKDEAASRSESSKKLPMAANVTSFTRNKLEVDSRFWGREDTV